MLLELVSFLSTSLFIHPSNSSIRRRLLQLPQITFSCRHRPRDPLVGWFRITPALPYSPYSTSPITPRLRGRPSLPSGLPSNTWWRAHCERRVKSRSCEVTAGTKDREREDDWSSCFVIGYIGFRQGHYVVYIFSHFQSHSNSAIYLSAFNIHFHRRPLTIMDAIGDTCTPRLWSICTLSTRGFRNEVLPPHQRARVVLFPLCTGTYHATTVAVSLAYNRNMCSIQFDPCSVHVLFRSYCKGYPLYSKSTRD